MSWIVITIKPNQSKKAEANLNAQNIDCFFPKLELKQENKNIEKNLFPGYAFVKIESWDQLLPVSSTRGVARIISFSGKIPTMHKSIISEIKNKLSSISISHEKKPIKKDDNVIINASLFDGLEARVIDTLKKKESQVVLLQIMNHPQTIWFNIKDISSIESVFDDYTTL